MAFDGIFDSLRLNADITLRCGGAAVLHLSVNTGSFLRPLSAKEEQEYVKKMLNGDIEARNTLVEHNLRLVAHIVKKYYRLYSNSVAAHLME